MSLGSCLFPYCFGMLGLSLEDLPETPPHAHPRAKTPLWAKYVSPAHIWKACPTQYLST